MRLRAWSEHREVLILGTTVLALAGVFAAGLWMPPEFARGTLYLPVMVLALCQTRRTFVDVVTVTAVAGTWFDLIIAPLQSPTVPLVAALMNRAAVTLALLVLWAMHRRQIIVESSLDRAAGQSLRRRQQEFDELAEHLPIQIWTATPDGQVDFVGRNLVVFSGRSSDEILADWLDLLHPDDRTATLERWRQALADGTTYRTEFRLRRADGVYLWHLTQAVPMRDAAGRIDRWLGSSMNVDHIKALREEADALTRRLQKTVERITDAFFTLDHAYRVTYVNARAAALMEQDPEQLLGRPIWESCKLSEDSPFAVRYRQAMTTQQPVYFQERSGADGSWLDVRAYPSPEGLTVYFLDIMQQRQQQRELQLLRTAVSRVNDIIMITEAEPIDAPGPRILFVNEAFERRTGYRLDEVIGKTPRILQGPDTQRDALMQIRRALSRREPVRAQVLNYTKDGDPLWLDLDIVPIVDANGWHTHWVSVKRDITEQRQLATQLRATQKMEAIGQLTGGLAHDFNNLLTVILGNAELLAEQLEATPALASSAQMIGQAALQGAALVRNLLAFARRQSLSPQAVAVDALIRASAPILQTALTQNHRLVIRFAEDLRPARVDPGQLESALLNLANNARDAMRDGGTLTIIAENTTVDAAESRRQVNLKEGNYVRVTVADTGCGIPHQHLDKVFEPFFSTKSPGKGSGLGLSSVSGFIRQSGGYIAVESEPDRGTTFRLWLPRAEETGESARAGSDVGRPAVEHPGWRILLVEDDAAVRTLAVAQLQAAGFHVEAASDGEQALQMLECGPVPDLLFTDVIMPSDFSGAALARAARQRYPELPILFTSGFVEDEQLPESVANGARLLIKPYQRVQLLQAVSAALRGERS